MEKTTILFMAILYQVLRCADSCFDLQTTITRVPDCPRTEAEWNVAAIRKKCDSVCDTSRYHCLITKEMNATIEVCAVPMFMQGFCAYFNVEQNRIRNLYAADCSKFTTPCPTRYESTEAFKYPACYDLIMVYATVAPKPTSLSTDSISLNISGVRVKLNGMMSSDSIPVLPIILPVLLIIVIGIVIVVVVWMKRRGSLQFEKPSGKGSDLEQRPISLESHENIIGEREKLLENEEDMENERERKHNAEIEKLKRQYDARLEEMNKEIKRLQQQKDIQEGDKMALMMQVIEKNQECKQLNNKLQEAKGNIRVLCRIKDCDGPKCLSSDCKFVKLNGTEKKYTFERVFGEKSTQVEVYREIQELVRSFLDGYNLSIFAYGQTGSGKTYTMEGPNWNKTANNENQGIIPRAMQQVFKAIEDLKVCGWKYHLKASYMELYNEKIRDLSKGSTDNEDHVIRYPKDNDKAMVTNLTEEDVCNEQEVLNFYEKCSKNRTSAKTEKNERSSRSHAIFRLEMTGKVENVEGIKDTCSGTLTLVDLAGSEKLATSMSSTAGQETKNINLSLLELTKVLRSLRSKDPTTYRNSKLTHLLKNSLGGNSKTLMIVNVSPATECQNETVRSLEFGRDVSKVILENIPRKNK
ncbi:protein claret segregational-like [Saccostrea echinata]|uniref:protein claret segregational-like n=1 Tax=Saccostrea echinata TaxID=191078 RepID=UPI002A82146B|nr:protein claret segregational-like [Saccostrea echinata]